MDIKARVSGVLTSAAKTKGITVDELIKQIISGELREKDKNLWNKLDSTFGKKLQEMFKKEAEGKPREEKESSGEENTREETEILDEEYYEEYYRDVRKYTGNFNFLLDDYSIEFARNGHRGFNNQEYRAMFLDFITKINLEKKETSYHRQETEKELIRRMISERGTPKNKQEEVELRILQERLKVIKEKENEYYR